MSRHLCFTDKAWDEYVYWQSQDRKTLKRINTLIEATKRDPFAGIGKPEALLGDMSGFWSRRIDERHRLVYAVDEDALTILACRYHYSE
jgi:toxin YoeB